MSQLQLPARIGKYELQEFLGGGMSHVYRAKDTVLGRPVAIKILTDAGCADGDAKARFLHEARMAGNIVHENIVSIYDFGEEQNRPFMVMEFVVGESLRDAIKYNRTGDLHNKLSIAVQISMALAYIHSKKIIHRDVKPENIQITSAGKVKLMDFGIAKSEGLALTRAGFTLGTPYYMAPEQVLGHQVTHLVDIYAFGVLLFELLAGVKPITGETVERIFNQILYEPLNLEPLRLHGTPAPIYDLIARCTSKSPSERVQKFELVTQELQRIMEDPAAPSVLPAPPAAVSQTSSAAAAPAMAPVASPQPVPEEYAEEDEDPGMLRFLPPSMRSQAWLGVFTALAVMIVLFLLYLVYAFLKK